MNKKRLIKVAEFLENLQKKEDEMNCNVFNFAFVVFTGEYNVDSIRDNKVTKDSMFVCGSLFCACGLLPIIDPESGIKWDCTNVANFSFDIRDESGATGYVAVASNYFDISKDDAGFLFTSDSQHKIKNWGDANVCNDDATAKEVADAIRHFIAIKEQAK